MTTTTLRLPPRIARLPQLRQIVRGGLAARGSVGAGLAAKAGGAAGAVRIHDQFTDTDGTLLSAHTIAPVNNGAAWTNDAAEPGMRIVGNRATPRPGGVSMSRCNSGYADCVVSVILTHTTVSASHSAGLAVRQTNFQNYWLIRLYNGALQMYDFNAGAPTLRASASFAMSNGAGYLVEVVLLGSTISATVDGGTPISYSSATFNQTVQNHGLRLVAFAAGAVYADDFKITA